MLNEDFIKWISSDLFIIKWSYWIKLQVKDFRDFNDIDIIISLKNLELILLLKDKYNFKINEMEYEAWPYWEIWYVITNLDFLDWSKIQIHELEYNLFDWKIENWFDKLYFKNINWFYVLDLKSISNWKLKRLEYLDFNKEEDQQVWFKDFKDLIFLMNKNLIKISVD